MRFSANPFLVCVAVFLMLQLPLWAQMRPVGHTVGTVLDQTGAVVFGRQGVIYQPRIPDDLVNYAMVLTFNAIRDKSCDESARLLGASADSFSLAYARDGLELESLDEMLPCYVVTGSDFQGASRKPSTTPLRAHSGPDRNSSGR